MVKKYEITELEKHNRLIILFEDNPTYTSGGNKKRVVEVLCECGTIKNVRLSEILNGKTQSCGCYNKEQIVKNKTTHDLSGTRLYSIWKDMKRRCVNPKRNNYKNYGALGIRVCDEWSSDYIKFHEWAMDNGYKENLSIDRIEHTGNYEPSNCRWIPISEQNSNTRRQKPFIAINPNGIIYEARVIEHFAKEHNLNAKCISDCILGKQHTHKGWKFKRINENE